MSNDYILLQHRFAVSFIVTFTTILLLNRDKFVVHDGGNSNFRRTTHSSRILSHSPR